MSIFRRDFFKVLLATGIVPFYTNVQGKDLTEKKRAKETAKTLDAERKRIQRAIDRDLDNPFLYVRAAEDLQRGDIVVRVDRAKTDDAYLVEKIKRSRGKHRYALGIVHKDMKAGDYGLIQIYGTFNYGPGQENIWNIQIS